MPAEAFPTRIRSTAHGVSAAAGKCGAITGAMGLLYLWYSYCTLQAEPLTGIANCAVASAPTAAQQAQIDSGLVVVLYLCAGVSVAGNVMTFFFIPRDVGRKSLAEVDASSETLRRFDAAPEPGSDGAVDGGEGGEGGALKAVAHEAPPPPPPVALIVRAAPVDPAPPSDAGVEGGGA